MINPDDSSDDRTAYIPLSLLSFEATDDVKLCIIHNLCIDGCVALLRMMVRAMLSSIVSNFSSNGRNKKNNDDDNEVVDSAVVGLCCSMNEQNEYLHTDMDDS